MVHSQDTRLICVLFKITIPGRLCSKSLDFSFSLNFFPSAQIYKRFNFTSHILRDSVNTF